MGELRIRLISCPALIRHVAKSTPRTSIFRAFVSPYDFMTVSVVSQADHTTRLSQVSGMISPPNHELYSIRIRWSVKQLLSISCSLIPLLEIFPRRFPPACDNCQASQQAISPLTKLLSKGLVSKLFVRYVLGLSSALELLEPQASTLTKSYAPPTN